MARSKTFVPVRILLKGLSVSFLILFLLSTTSQAQQRCGTVEYTNKLKSQNLLENDAQFEQWMTKKINNRKQQLGTERSQSTYQVPIVVHVIHNGEAVGTGTNISDAQIISQIDVLNKDFNRLNADASNTPAEFTNA